MIRVNHVEELIFPGDYIDVEQIIRLTANSTITRLTIYGNHSLTYFPPQLCMKSLEFLCIRDTELSSIPSEISRMKNLHTLILASNKISHLPEELWKLTSLKILDVGDNPVDYLSDKIATLPYLHSLDLSDTHIKEVPPLPKTVKNYVNPIPTLPLSFPPPPTNFAPFLNPDSENDTAYS